jgi:hypothetical protein
MRIIFLDIDGVLNSQSYHHKCGGYKGSSRSAEFLDPDAIDRLNYITNATHAKIVLSSSWRYGYTNNLEGLQEMFQRNKIEADVIGMTPIIAGPRGAEIQSWLDTNKDASLIESFIIFDDSDDMIHLSPRLIRTSLAYGLTSEHIRPAITLLLTACTLEYRMIL